MDEFNAGLTLMNMLHAGSHAEWQKDLRDAGTHAISGISRTLLDII